MQTSKRHTTCRVLPAGRQTSSEYANSLSCLFGTYPSSLGIKPTGMDGLTNLLPLCTNSLNNEDIASHCMEGNAFGGRVVVYHPQSLATPPSRNENI